MQIGVLYSKADWWHTLAWWKLGRCNWMFCTGTVDLGVTSDGVCLEEVQMDVLYMGLAGSSRPYWTELVATLSS